MTDFQVPPDGIERIGIKINEGNVRNYGLLSSTRRCQIGRSAGCNVQFEAPTVSGLHASIFFSAGNWVIRDDESTNGTLLNGESIESKIATILARGDLIGISTEHAISIEIVSAEEAREFLIRKVDTEADTQELPVFTQ